MTGSRSTLAARINPPPVGRRLLAGLTILFFYSGALALIYEVIWQRQFALVFGSAAPGTAAVLAAYFAGLGMGSLALGRAAKKWSRPLRSYAVLEALIGAGALLVVPLLHGFERIYPWLFERLAGVPAVFFAIKLLLAFICIVIPTFCMGGTLPVLAQLLDRGQRHLGLSAGLLYMANTAGAALGALSVPFFLLPLLGIKGAFLFAAAGNALVVCVAWWMDWRWGEEQLNHPLEKDSPESKRTEAGGSPASSRRPAMRRIPGTVALALISGLVTFTLQVQWNRAFAQVHENSLYSFAIIAAMFIFALAVGTQLARFLLRRNFAPPLLLGWAWIAAGALVMATPWLFAQLTGGMGYLPIQGDWMTYGMRLVLLTLAVLFLPVTLLGVGLPTLMEQAGHQQDTDAGAVLGRLLSANVLGSVSGALLAGFVLPKFIGLWKGIFLAGGALLLAGGWQLQRHRQTPSRQWQFRLGLAAATGVLLCVMLMKVDLPRVRIAGSQSERLIAISEGTYGIVAVVERPQSRRLKLNNYYVLGGTASTGDERMQAHIPLLLHPSPRQAAFLGLGTGITASGALFHPVENIVAVELVPEVVTAARVYFDEANEGLFRDARSRIVIEDARNYLRSSIGKFDVIVGDLVVPWRQGESALFTVEQFAAARERLAPGGIFCQWLPLFQLSERELNILCRTFLSVFPRAYVCRGDFSPDEPAIAMVGMREPFHFKPATIERRLRELRPDPANPLLAEPMAFWMYFVGMIQSEDLPDHERRINREDRPWIELMAPLRQSAPFTGRGLQTWLKQLNQRSSGRLSNLGEMDRAGMRAGELLFEFTLLLSEQNEKAAREVQSQLRALLPEPVFKAILPESPPQTNPQ